ncbi:GGDEF domain-containing protein [Gordoniibacillus kamchatkensis]|uniref:GGDEF domain-containing protein n=1 Tax=Gordoniibacillus kamchatkensis TaxID=1590651 RepID=UPI000697FCE6|nr:GGDEF domain-containing protein [Paenibacillus sp. VKM B-2647]
MATWSIVKLFAANLGVMISFIYMASLIHKWWLPQLRIGRKRLLFGVAAVLAGWLSMAYAFPLGGGPLADLRLVPLVVAPMFVKRAWAYAAIGAGIGLGRFWLGWGEGALTAFLGMALAGCLAALLHRLTLDADVWTFARRMLLFVLVLNVFYAAYSVMFGVFGPERYFAGGGLWVLPVRLLLCGGFVLLLRDLQLEYARRAALMEEASRDFLTKLYNVRTFERVFPGLTERLAKEGKPLSVAFLDIDFFKKVNDTYGHGAGDIVLRRVAEALARLTRWNDFVGRYGGEEFIIVLPDCPREEALHVAERIRAYVQDMPIAVEKETIRITVSIGIATFPDVNSDLLVEAADKALYEAKRSGRNRVCEYARNL